jgi:hypothetical protein
MDLQWQLAVDASACLFSICHRILAYCIERALSERAQIRDQSTNSFVLTINKAMSVEILRDSDN